MMQSCRELSQDLPGCKRHIVKGCSARLCVALVCGAGAAGWFGRGAPSTASDSRPARWLRIAYPAGEPLPGWLPVASTVSEPALHALERIGLRADCDARVRAPAQSVCRHPSPPSGIARVRVSGRASVRAKARWSTLTAGRSARDPAEPLHGAEGPGSEGPSLDRGGHPALPNTVGVWHS